MGINSKAIEKIDEQIRMLNDDFEYDGESSIEETDELEEESTTLRVHKISDLDDIDFLNKKDISDDTEDNTNKIEKIDDEIKDEIVVSEAESKESKILNCSNDSDEGVNIFLIYYIGIVLFAIVVLVIIYFLFT